MPLCAGNWMPRASGSVSCSVSFCRALTSKLYFYIKTNMDLLWCRMNTPRVLKSKTWEGLQGNTCFQQAVSGIVLFIHLCCMKGGSTSCCLSGFLGISVQWALSMRLKSTQCPGWLWILCKMQVSCESAAPFSTVELRAFPERPQGGGERDPEGEVALFFADTQLLILPPCPPL